MDRVTTNSARGLLEQAGLAVAAGSVNVISVLAIRQRSGDRWPRKREQVEDFVSRAFARAASPHDMVAALNDVEFLTVQPEASKAAALALSANVLKETLNFFLGAAAREDLKLFFVTGLDGEELAVEAVDAATLSSAAEPAAAAPSRPAAAAPATLIGTEALRRRVRLVSMSGPHCEIDLGIEPTWNIGARVVTSFLVRAAIRLDGEDAPAPDAPTVAGEAAMQALAYAADLLSNGPEGLHVGLHTPLSIGAMGHSASRYRLLHALQSLDPAIRRLLLIEIIDLPAGFPQSRMTEVVAALAPYGRAVLARAPSETADLASWRRCGLGGVTLDCSHLDPADRKARVRLGRFAAAAAEVAPACVGYSLASRSLLISAWAAGFTHLGGAAVEAEVRTPAAQRLEPSQLYPDPVRRSRSAA
ncbi:hypothetical protein [Phenylobacterium sp.]|jgi:hypothetical protein|uniref:hypothetical protein n=1 Tax=Phenylobacterium sp. TaxID=1871053 RepID=UPI002F417CA6